MLFPFLFITIACGACSGFHSIVASGTTSKQVRTEKDIRPVGYGAMLLESMVAVFALACVMVLAPGSPMTTGAPKPDLIYAIGIGGKFMAQCGIPAYFGISFGLLAFSSFVFDTLDVCTRLGRYVLQEMTGLKGLSGGAVATLMTLGGPSLYLWKMPAGSFKTFWIIFGTSNQLLAALTLVGVSVWLWRTGRPVWFTLVPAVFMILSTGTALILNFRTFLGKYRHVKEGTMLANMSIAAVLFMLGAFVVFEALRVWRMTRVPALAAV
jgi:carbon starvation protein